MKDHSKTKPLPAKEDIMKCPHCGEVIGETAEGGDGTEVEHSEDERGGPDLDDMEPAADSKEDQDKGKKKKQSKESAMALMAATLGSKFGKK